MLGIILVVDCDRGGLFGEQEGADAAAAII